MCGIAGVLSLDAPIGEKDVREAREMTDLLRHRGPDDRGMYDDELCALGNTRLKIIDLSDNARLPMCNEDRTVWITYNGEVTNFRELKERFRLEEKHAFRSTSDTEVLVHLYEEIGIDFLKHLTGMFAFCLYDKRRKKAYVVRDFYGIRPLFYMVAGDRFYFASEIKSFMGLERFQGALDHEATYHFLSLAYIPGEHTPFKEIRELQGSRLFEVDLERGAYEEREYYELRYDTDDSIEEKQAVVELHEQMLDSVRRNLISDAPLGLTLSGGVDTSSILALTDELGLARDIHTFSIVMDEASFNESRYQQVAVDAFKPIHHEILVKPRDVLDRLVDHMAYLDEPSGDGAAIPSYLLAEQAKKHVSVLLSGEGGDEVFNAYETHLAYKVRKLYRKYAGRNLRHLIRFAAHHLPLSYSKLSLDFVAKRFTTGAELDVPEAHFYWRHALSEEDKRRLMPSLGEVRRTDSFFSEMFHALDFDDELNRISAIDIRYYFIGDLMVKNDRTLMAHSIEARFPFMDRLLTEYVNRIPTRLRIKGLRRRYMEKQAMKPLLPRKIWRRKNMGLEMPHSLWFLGEFREAADRYFSKKNIEKTEILDYQAVRNLWEEHIARKRDNGRSLWCILNYLVWFDLFVWNKDFRKYLS